MANLQCHISWACISEQALQSVPADTHIYTDATTTTKIEPLSVHEITQFFWESWGEKYAIDFLTMEHGIVCSISLLRQSRKWDLFGDELLPTTTWKPIKMQFQIDKIQFHIYAHKHTSFMQVYALYVTIGLTVCVGMKHRPFNDIVNLNGTFWFYGHFHSNKTWLPQTRSKNFAEFICRCTMI